MTAPIFEVVPSSIYIANHGSNNVSIIDIATNTIKATVPVGEKPYGVADLESYVYVTGSNGVYAIGKHTHSVETILNSTLSVVTNPQGIAVTFEKGYVANNCTSNVSVFDSSSHMITATVPVGANPSAVAVSPDLKKVYISNNNDSTISVINTSTNTVTTTINEVGLSYPNGITITPDGKRIYVTNSGSSTISVIDTATNNITATVNIGNTDIPIFDIATQTVITTRSVPSVPIEIAVTLDGTKVYVTN